MLERNNVFWKGRTQRNIGVYAIDQRLFGCGCMRTARRRCGSSRSPTGDAYAALDINLIAGLKPQQAVTCCVEFVDMLLRTHPLDAFARS
jgi:hypothetical protein